MPHDPDSPIPDSPVRRALWFVENHLGGDLRLEQIAAAAGVSRFHLARSFVASVGVSVMQYARRRRLSEAARALAAGAPDIFSVALAWGYGSHEAFTRAFVAELGITPEALRASGSLSAVQLTEVWTMHEATLVEVAPPRQQTGHEMRIAGLSESYTFATNHGIPMLWERFADYLGRIPGQIGGVTYGVCYNVDRDSDCGFDYLAGVEVVPGTELPAAFNQVDLAPARYAVFTHRGHISGIRDTVYSIWTRHLAGHGYRPSGAPDFERYTAAFDPQTGNGDVEIWIPVV